MTLKERPNSPIAVVGGADGSSLSRRYRIFGTNNDEDAINFLINNTPDAANLGGVALTKVIYELTGYSEKAYDAEVRYERAEPGDDPNESTFQFETGGGTIHVDRAIATRQIKTHDGSDPPDFQNLIGVNGDEVTGADIVSAMYQFSESHVFSDEAVTPEYKAALFRATGKINAEPFKGFKKGEVLFLGASGAKRGNENWRLDFRFVGAENIENLTVADIPGINKGGHDYLWLNFRDDVDQDYLIKKVRAVVVNQVYIEWDFSTIGIGT